MLGDHGGELGLEGLEGLAGGELAPGVEVHLAQLLAVLAGEDGHGYSVPASETFGCGGSLAVRSCATRNEPLAGLFPRKLSLAAGLEAEAPSRRLHFLGAVLSGYSQRSRMMHFGQAGLRAVQT